MNYALSLLLFYFCLLSTYRPVLAAVVAVGNVQSCFNNGSEQLDCAKKMLVTLTLENNKLHQTEALQFSVACVNSPTGQCPCPCIYNVDPGCTCRDLRRIISIGITKTPVYALYPLSQPRTFNGRPYEDYITTGYGGTAGDTCFDAAFDAQPTCGWAKAPDVLGNMQDIPNSQGFCCRCSSFGGADILRGYRSCQFSTKWLPSRTPGSAHCLRYDDNWWYRGYVIGTYQLDFDIQVHINTTDIQPPVLSPEDLVDPESPQRSSLEVLSVNPSRTFTLNSNRSVAARLLGDLDSYRQVQVLDGHWLMIPVQPGIDPNEVLTSNLDMWVVLPPTMVTTTGECNRVGVGYSAFRAQADACGQAVGTCLENQIFDLGEADAARVEANLEPLYNITRYGGGWANVRQLAAGLSGGGLSLRLPLRGVRTSLLSLEVRADDLQLVINRAPGKILSFEVCTFDGKQCGGFQAIASKGFLRVAVNNTGAVAAEFRASVLSCSPGVLPAGEEFATIAPSQVHTFAFDLSMESDQEGNRTCTVTVTDAAGDIADFVDIQFYTNATAYEPPPDQSDLGDKPVRPGDPRTYSTCRQMCPNIFNVKCLVFSGCWKRLAQGVATMALIAALATMLFLAVRRGWVKRVVSCLGICGPTKRRLKRAEHISRRRHSFLDAYEDHSGDAGTPPPVKKEIKGDIDFAMAAAMAMYSKQWRHAGAGGPSQQYGTDNDMIGAYHQHMQASHPSPVQGPHPLSYRRAQSNSVPSVELVGGPGTSQLFMPRTVIPPVQSFPGQGSGDQLQYAPQHWSSAYTGVVLAGDVAGMSGGAPPESGDGNQSTQKESDDLAVTIRARKQDERVD